jgi:hypothetical protein
MNAQHLAKFAEVMDMVKTMTFVVNHIARNRKAAFGQAIEDGTSCYISPKYIKQHDLEEGMLIKARVVDNKRDPETGRPTKWRCVSILECGWIDDEIEEVGSYVPEPEPEPEVTLEDRVVEWFLEHPDDCVTTRDLSEEILDDKGLNQDVAGILRHLHTKGDDRLPTARSSISKITIKTNGNNKRGKVIWGLTEASFGFDHVEEVDDEEVEIYED